MPSRRHVLAMLLALAALPALAGTSTGAEAGGAAKTCSRRVVTLFQGATDTAVALGVVPVGVVESWLDKPVYPYLRAALADTTLVGLETQPSLEDIALLAPDLIVASRFRHQRIEPLLSALAPVVMLDDIYRYRDTLTVMASALGLEARGQALSARLAARLAQLRARLKAHFGARWPLTVSLIDVRANEVRSYLASSFGGSVLAALGFRWNAAQRRLSGVLVKLSGIESLPTLDAEVFFVMRHSRGAAVAAHYRRLQAHLLWQRMDAPRHGEVREVDAIDWSLSGGILGVFAMLDDVDAWLAADERRART